MTRIRIAIAVALALPLLAQTEPKDPTHDISKVDPAPLGGASEGGRGEHGPRVGGTLEGGAGRVCGPLNGRHLRGER